MNLSSVRSAFPRCRPSRPQTCSSLSARPPAATLPTFEMKPARILSRPLTAGEDSRIAGCRASPVLGRNDEVVVPCTRSHEKAERYPEGQDRGRRDPQGQTFRWNIGGCWSNACVLCARTCQRCAPDDRRDAGHQRRRTGCQSAPTRSFGRTGELTVQSS